RAVWEGDLDRVVELMTPAERADAVGHWKYRPGDTFDYERGDIDASGSGFFMLKQRMATPFVDRITGGSVDGDTAWVDFSGSEGVIGHDEVTGTAVMKRDRKGRWSVDRFATRDAPETGDPELDGLEDDEDGETRCGAGDPDDAPKVCIGGNVFFNGVRVD